MGTFDIETHLAPTGKQDSDILSKDGVGSASGRRTTTETPRTQLFASTTETRNLAFSMAFATPATKRGDRLPSQSVKALAAKMAAAIKMADLRVWSFTGISPARIRGGKRELSIAHRLPSGGVTVTLRT